jgi:hypothetical protein
VDTADASVRSWGIPVAVPGEFRCPSVGISIGRLRGF